MAITTPGVVPASVLVTGHTPGWLTTFARFARRTRYEDLPEEVVARTRLVILDCIGAMLAGRREPEVAEAERRLGRTGRSGSKLLRAFLGGTAGTMLEIDEGNQYARGHPGIHVVPAVLALAADRKVTGASAILATALGYEIGARIGIASKLRVTMHPHGTWGTVGAALAVARLRGAGAGEIAETINVASSLGLTTSRRTMLEGATVRNTYAGFSNMLGIMAHDLVRSGFTGEVDGVGSVYGGIAADDWRPEEMVRDLGTRWEIARNYFKRHAACRYNHGALDALARIVAEAGGRLDPEAIRAIEVKTYVWAAQLDHPEPASMLAAKFSMPFSLATFIVNGGATLDAFRDPAREDAVTRALARRVRVDEDPALTAMLPGLRPARVTVTLTDGRVFTAEALTNKGDTEDPYAATEVEAKFMEVAAPAIGTDAAGAVARAVLGLDKAATLGGILELIDMK
ncbi:2-methylcitrate dehydratase [Prosthecomicrobium hirschii]|uniref:2-methylcitrate dehydratase n=1 Tax=Prosthecodimorpha hirschii TaxID=665126 RepID=A0A0P6VGZ7_9HYPH|nr:MmgE/PrpD family protein [Prosthecomicrobium hirschii]KPL51299.1 2-methylcitrate dehydratase [Prosthecomicrobium hirschii]